jgi:hypothetical protein
MSEEQVLFVSSGSFNTALKVSTRMSKGFMGGFTLAHEISWYMVYLAVSEAKTSAAEVMAQGFSSVLRDFYKPIGYKTI